MKKQLLLIIMSFSMITFCKSQNVNLLGDNVAKYDFLRSEMNMKIVDAKITVSDSYRTENGTVKMEISSITERKQKEDNIEFLILSDKQLTEIEIEGETKIEKEFSNLTGEKINLIQNEGGDYKIENEENYTDEEIKEIREKYAYKEDFSEMFFYPKSVKIGDSWTVEGNKLLYITGGIKAEGKCELTLVKVDDDNGDKIATIFFNMDATTTDLDAKSNLVKMNFVLNGKIKRSLVYGIDRDMNSTGMVTLSMNEKESGQGVSFEIIGKCTMKGRERLYEEK